EYLSAVAGGERGAVADLRDDRPRRANLKPTAQRVRFESVALITADGQPVSRIPQGSRLRFEATFRVSEPLRFLELYCRVKTGDSVRLFSSFSEPQEDLVAAGFYRVVCEFEENDLLPSTYIVELVAKGAENEDIVPNALVFEVESTTTAEEDFRYGRASGVLRVDSTWTEIEPIEETVPAEASV
ncbi:MAG: Wzt C-terminal domain, partial [Gaiellaceae bacterium]|nr:Wzt C-terminal domain [Gaiellaceae bacterium]